MATILRTFSSLLLLFLFFFLSLTAVQGQSPAPAPTASGPTNITAVLEKAGQFTMFIRILKSTQEADQINNQLNTSSSSQGLTVFAPPDNAFSNLKSGALNSLSDQQKVQLVQFHVLPTLLTTTQFQTVSNPLRTQAGDGQKGQFPLNVTSTGNQVNITTGVVNATVANTIYTDKQLAVYQVDQVLLPLALFGSPDSKAPAPAPELDKGGSMSKGTSGSDDSGSTGSSAERGLELGLGLATMAAIASSMWI